MYVAIAIIFAALLSLSCKSIPLLPNKSEDIKKRKKEGKFEYVRTAKYSISTNLFATADVTEHVRVRKHYLVGGYAVDFFVELFEKIITLGCEMTVDELSGHRVDWYPWYGTCFEQGEKRNKHTASKERWNKTISLCVNTLRRCCVASRRAASVSAACNCKYAPRILLQRYKVAPTVILSRWLSRTLILKGQVPDTYEWQKKKKMLFS